MKICRFLLTVLIFILFIIPAVSLAWQGKVVKVSDGNTIEVLHNGIAEKIRLYGIDCPEKKQDFGERAKQFTSGRIFSRIVEIDPVTRDRYGNFSSGIFHKPGCMGYNCINCNALFSTRNEALAAGYRPCGFCRP